MKKSIFLFFAAILCAMSISAANMKGGEVLYLKPNSNWTQASARFAIYLCNGSSTATWVKMTKSGDYYMATVPTGDYKNVIFCRMDPANQTDDWSSKWNQSGDLTFDAVKNLCTINSGQWDCGTNVAWSTHKPTSTASLATSSANIFVGGQATLTPSISNTNVNTLKSTSYTISPTTGASISGNTFTATVEGTYTVTATITYYPNGCTSLTSGLNTATATTTITASVPAEETNNVTVSYKFGTTEIATATTIASVGVETPSEATAPAITGYTFANWTLGAGVATEDELTANPIDITTKSGETDYTLTANYEKFKLTYTVTVPEGTEKCYIVGEMNGWDIDNPIEMTSQGSNVFTVTLEDVTESTQYKYTSQKSWDYADVNESNRTWSASDVVTAWKDPLITNVYLYGAMNGWKDTNPFKKETKEASTASVTVTLEAGTDYEFKIVDDGKWKSNATAITGTITGWTFTEGGGNAKLTTVAAGDYVFTWEMSTSKLSIAYPEVTPEYKDITIQVYANEIPNIWWWNGGDKCADADDAYDWGTAPAMEAVVIDGNTWYQKTFKDVDVALGGIKFKLKSQDQSKESNELQTTEDKCYDARVIATVTETPCGQLPTGETPKVTYNVEVPAGTNTCYIAGEMNSWTLTEMTKVDDTHYTITIEGATTEHTYKYASGPDSDWKYVEVKADGSDVSNRIYNANDVVEKWKAVYDPSAPVYKYYIVGSMNSWNQSSADYGMTDDDEDGIYEKTLTLKNNDEFKVKGNDWYGFDAIEGAYVETSLSDENDRNIKITLDADKEVTVKFNSETKEITFEGLTEVETETLVYTVEVPEGTEDCYIAGQMNNWEFDQMTQVDATHWTITYDNVLQTTEYKYACQASWDYKELDKEGNDIANRTWTALDKVEKWAEPAAPVPTTYTVAGDNEAVFGTKWDPTNTANDMVLDGELYKWTKTNVALSANTEIKFQVVKNHDWNQGQWPGNGNDWVLNTITEDGLYTITITFKEDDKTINATATKTGDVVTKDFSNQPATLYFHPSTNWTADGAEFAAYFYNNGPGADAEPTWKSMTADANGVYEVPNAKEHEYVIFCRMNPARTENNWDDTNMWNQISTGLTIPNTTGDLNTCCAIWENLMGDIATEKCTWVVPTPLTDANWATIVNTYKDKKINLIVERTFVSGQNHTLCLPFNLPTNWLGENSKAYQLSSIVSNSATELELKVTEHTTMLAGQPYIVNATKGNNDYDHLIVSNVTVTNATAGANVVTGGGFKATLQAVTATNGTTDGSTEYYIGATTGNLHKEVTDKLGLRALVVLTNTDGTAVQGVRARVAFNENVETGVEDIIATDAPVKVIVNGQLIIIRDGVKYNVQGQKL